MIDPNLVGTELQSFVVDIDKSQVALFAKAVGLSGPEIGDGVVPPTFLLGMGAQDDSAFKAIAKAGGDMRTVLHGEQGFEYLREVRVGDRLRFRNLIADVYTKRDGALEFVVQETQVHDDKDGESVAVLRSVMVFRNKGAK